MKINEQNLMGDDSIESPLKGKWVNYHPSMLHHNMEIEIQCFIYLKKKIGKNACSIYHIGIFIAANNCVGYKWSGW